MPNLSILIPTFNRPTEFGYLISTLVSNLKIDYEIIVLDNNPESDRYVDNTLRLLGKYSGLDLNRVKVHKGENCSEIRFRPNLIKLASGKYIWFIDDDCVIDTLGLSELVIPSDDQDFYTLDNNQFFMESEIYSKVYSYNLYDIVFKRDLFNYDDFINTYPDPWEFKLGGDKELMKSINFYNSPHFNISNRPVVINLYRRNGDNLMLNN